jgi:hypothetical protein
MPTIAGSAVDGNTDGEFLNKSTTHTNYEQGAWWQVDLGSKKKARVEPGMRRTYYRSLLVRVSSGQGRFRSRDFWSLCRE